MTLGPVVRADYLWTWHGDLNLFQGSFEVTDAEMLAGAQFGSSLFTNSVSINSLDGITYHANNSYALYAGTANPSLNLTLVLADEGTLSQLTVRVVPNQASFITEDSPLPFGKGFENGVWTAQYIPEPSAVALLAVGGILCLVAVRRGRQGRSSMRRPWSQ